MTVVCLGKHRENKAGLVTGFFHGAEQVLAKTIDTRFTPPFNRRPVLAYQLTYLKRSVSV